MLHRAGVGADRVVVLRCQFEVRALAIYNPVHACTQTLALQTFLQRQRRDTRPRAQRRFGQVPIADVLPRALLALFEGEVGRVEIENDLPCR